MVAPKRSTLAGFGVYIYIYIYINIIMITLIIILIMRTFCGHRFFRAVFGFSGRFQVFLSFRPVFGVGEGLGGSRDPFPYSGIDFSCSGIDFSCPGIDFSCRGTPGDTGPGLR